MYLCKRHFIKFYGIFIIPTGKQVECIEVHKTNYLIYSKLMYCIYIINAPFVSQFVYPFYVFPDVFRSMCVFHKSSIGSC